MKGNSLFTVGMCGGALWNVSINDGQKGHVLHRHRDTVLRERTERGMERGGTEVIGQGDHRRRKMRSGYLGGSETS